MDNLNITGRSGRKSGRIGGGRSVFDQVHNQSRISNGAIIINPPAVGGMIFEGDLGEYDYQTNGVMHLKVYKLAKAVLPTDTEVVFHAGEYNHVLEAGLNLMPITAIDQAETSVKVGTITKGVLPNGSKVVKFPITAGALGASEVAVGKLFIEANKAGAGAKQLIKPNVAFTTDIPIDQIPAVTPQSPTDYEGYIYYAPLFNECTIIAARATPIPAAFKDGLRSGYSDIKIFE